MIWTHNRAARIQPQLHSLRLTMSNVRHTAEQQELYQHKINWKIIGSMISLIIFFILLIFTVLGLPMIVTKMSNKKKCAQPSYWNFDENIINDDWKPPVGTQRLCAANAVWNSQGVTVAGLQNGMSSTSLSGLDSPRDIYVYDNGTILVADTMNNRITKWTPNATVGVLIAGTGAYGSWTNLLARPNAITVLDNQLIVSDQNNYRIQAFDLNSMTTSSDGWTLIGRYGQGSNLNQINDVTNLVTSKRFPSLLYICDSLNRRILIYNMMKKSIEDITGVPRGFKINSSLSFDPSTIAISENTMSIYIVDQLNDQIQKYDFGRQRRMTTVAGWGQLNNPYGIQLEPIEEHMFIADTNNHRILLWLNGNRQGRIIAGTGQAGSSTSQLYSPTQIRLDAKFNLYVADTVNSRIQRFDLVSNGC